MAEEAESNMATNQLLLTGRDQLGSFSLLYHLFVLHLSTRDGGFKSLSLVREYGLLLYGTVQCTSTLP
jgi:hypothetical protein